MANFEVDTDPESDTDFDDSATFSCANNPPKGYESLSTYIRVRQIDATGWVGAPSPHTLLGEDPILSEKKSIKT